MVVYEVNLSVVESRADEYREWLEAHIERMLALPGFVDARRFAVEDPVAPGRVELCVHYRLRDAAALEAYLAGPAAQMREEGRQRFGEDFSATRRVLHPAAAGAPSG